MKLYRVEATDTETMGILCFPGFAIHVLERPWIPDAPGGTPSLSCVPAGFYELIPHTRPNGDKVVALVNPGLGVYYQPTDRPNQVGRYLVLIHPANIVEEIEGCLAPGMGRNGSIVTDSRRAMERIMAQRPTHIEIIEVT